MNRDEILNFLNDNMDNKVDIFSLATRLGFLVVSSEKEKAIPRMSVFTQGHMLFKIITIPKYIGSLDTAFLLEYMLTFYLAYQSENKDMFLSIDLEYTFDEYVKNIVDEFNTNKKKTVK